MKNQYNLMKSIDRNSSSSGSAADLSTTQNKQNKNGFGSKLQNLVAAKLATSKFSSSSSFSPEQKKPEKQEEKRKQEERNARIFTLSHCNNKQLKQEPSGYQPPKMQQPGVARLRQLETSTSPARPLGFLLPASGRKRLPADGKTALAEASSPTTAISEKPLAPELAKCYDEIDQIYDYIRGLAPLPMQLRKIKSIDFEQLEREKRHQQIEAANSKLLAASRQQSQNEPTRSHQRPVKVRQREASDLENEHLREPTSGGQQQQASSGAKQRIEGPLPIKVVTSSCNERPNIERVESLNLTRPSGSTNSANRPAEAIQSGGDTSRAPLHSTAQKPAYMISSAQRGQLFRLPRAHSTSTLNKSPGGSSAERHLVSHKSGAGRRLPEEEEEEQANTRTLPPLRLSRVAALEPMQVASLGRLGVGSRRAMTQQETPATGRPSTQRLSKQIDLVDSFVDDVSSLDGSSSSESGSESSSSSSSSSSSPSSSSETSLSQSTSSPASRDRLPAGRRNSSGSGQAARRGRRTSSAESDKPEPARRGSPSKQVSTGPNLTSSSTKSDKWAEKSHSDYENDTVSLSSDSSKASSSLSGLLESSPAGKSGRIRRSSSGTGTAGGEQAESHPAQSKPARARDADEHIYEQIPAHKNLIKQHSDAADRPRSLPHNHLLESSYVHYRQRQQQQQQQTRNAPTPNKSAQTVKPYNYPVAYAPSVAPAKRHQITAYLASATSPSQAVRTSVHNLAAVQQQRMKAAQGGTYPLPVAALHPAVHPGQRQPHQQHSNSYRAGHLQARPLDHRHGLSMSNLHLLPYLNQPIMRPYYPSNPFQQRQQPGADSRLSRSSSSSKVNRTRAPRLSPGQLIAQIQMPRAVNKRQQEFSQFTAPSSEANRNRKRPVFVWQPSANGGNMVQTNQPSEQQPSRPEHRAARRLTAIGIGIEEALDQSGIRRQLQQVGAAPNRTRAFEAPVTSSGQSKPAPVRLTAGYFEPPQLLKAPLIDDDEPISNEFSSSEQVDAVPAEGNKLLAHQQAAAFIQARCLNSISDLHSVSSGSDGASESQQSSSESPGVILNPRSNSRPSRPDKQARPDSDEGGGDFVSSRSFIKCYYGRDEGARRSAPDDAGSKPKPVERKEEAAGNGAKTAPKKRGTERLLGLIGMSANRQTGHKSRSGSESSAANRQRAGAQTAAPIAAMFVAGQQAQAANQARPQALLAGDFLDAEGPILVRDKRIAALRSNLVRHYQHPIVQVASVPNFAQKTRADGAKEPTETPRRSSRLQLEQAGSTDTTNSTSSYEAAIKNSQKVGADAAPIEDQNHEPPPPVRYSSRAAVRELVDARKSSGRLAASKSQLVQALIKVPKLSKQSHLINRPLPKPPSQGQSAGGGHSGARRAPMHLQIHREAAKQQQLAAGSRPALVAAGKRKPLVSTNLDAGSPNESTATRHKPTQEPAKPRPQSAGTGNGTGRLGKAGASSLSPLALSIGTQPSPTVTTCTSSGISSRLTAGTHLANSNSSSQRSGSGKSERHQRVKSFSELHKQAKAAAAERSAATASSGASTGGAESLNEKLGGASFALMDDSETQPSSPDCELGAQTRPARRPSGAPAKMEDEKALSSNLKLFDERFSSKFMDAQLASSNDSLLESINFSGTLNRKLQVLGKQR